MKIHYLLFLFLAACAITGNVVVIDSIDKSYNSDTVFLWTAPSSFEGLAINGVATGTGTARAYIVANGEQYLIHEINLVSGQEIFSSQCVGTCDLSLEQGKYLIRVEVDSGLTYTISGFLLSDESLGVGVTTSVLDNFDKTIKMQTEGVAELIADGVSELKCDGIIIPFDGNQSYVCDAITEITFDSYGYKEVNFGGKRTGVTLTEPVDISNVTIVFDGIVDYDQQNISLQDENVKLTGRVNWKEDQQVSVKSLIDGMNTAVIAIDNLNGSFEIELKKFGNVNVIKTCENFNVITDLCEGAWEDTNIPFEDLGDKIKFSVNHFSAYAGDEGEFVSSEYSAQELASAYDVSGFADSSYNGQYVDSGKTNYGKTVFEYGGAKTLFYTDYWGVDAWYFDTGAFTDETMLEDGHYAGCEEGITDPDEACEWVDEGGDPLASQPTITAAATSDPLLLTECGAITSPGYYNLTQNVSSAGTCFQIQSDDVTLDGKGHLINFSKSSEGYGVSSDSVKNLTVKNVQIYSNLGSGFPSAIYLSTTNNSLINNVTSNLDSLSGYGVYLSTSRLINISNSDIGGGITGIGIFLVVSKNNTLQENYVHGSDTAMQINSGSNDNNIFLNNFEGGAYGIRPGSSSYRNQIFSNNISGSKVIYASVANDYNFSSNNLFGGSTYFISSSSSPNMIFQNNSFNDSEKLHLSLTNGGALHRMILIDQSVFNYSIYSSSLNGALITLQNSSLGKVEFTSKLNGSGTNLSRDVVIGDASLNISLSENIGLNASANVTFFGTDSLGLTNRAPFKNGSLCSDCAELSDGDTYVFNITEAGYYTLGELPIDPLLLTSCGVINVSGYYNLTQDVSSEGTCFEIQTDNVTLDGKGYTMNYSNSLIGYGVNISRYSVNVTVRNSDIQITNSSNLNSYGVRSYQNSKVLIENNSINASTYGISVSTSSNHLSVVGNTIYSGYGFYGGSTSLLNSTIVNNTITAYGERGVSISSGYDYNNVSLNDIRMVGGSASQHGIYFSCSTNRYFQSLNNNNISFNGTSDSSAALMYVSNCDSSEINDNFGNITASGSNAVAIDLSGLSSMSFKRNHFISSGTVLDGYDLDFADIRDNYLNGSASRSGIVIGSNSMNCDVINNTVVGTGTALSTSSSSSSNHQIIDNNFTGSLMVASTRMNVENNTVNSSSRGIYVIIGYGSNVSNNVIFGETSGIEFTSTSQNSKFENNVIVAPEAIKFGSSSYGYNNNFTGNNLTSSTYDLVFAIAHTTPPLNSFLNQSIGTYSISSGTNLTYGTEWGRLSMKLGGMGSNLSNSMIFENGTLILNASANSQLDAGAQVILYETGGNNYSNPGVMRNGTYCSSCENTTLLNESTVSFSVPGEGIYTIAEIPPDPYLLTSCGDITSPGYYNLTQNVSSAGTCFQIQSDNVTLDGKGYAINYSQSLTGYGINISSNSSNILNISVLISSSQSNSYGIGFENGTVGGSIENVDVKSDGTSSYALFLSEAQDYRISDSTFFIGSDFYDVYVRNSRNIYFTRVNSIRRGIFSLRMHDSEIINSNLNGSVPLTLYNSNNATVVNNSIFGITKGIEFPVTQNSTFMSNNITLNTTGTAQALYASSQAARNYFSQNNVHAFSSTYAAQGMYLNQWSNENVFYDNDFLIEGVSGYTTGFVISWGCDDNAFINNTINFTNTGRAFALLKLNGNPPERTNFSGNTIFGSEIDINMSGEIVDVSLIDQNIGSYYLNVSGLVMQNESIARVSFINPLLFYGTNLSRDIVLGNASLNISLSENVGLNASANVTFFGTDSLGLTDKAVFKNGSLCVDCSELVDSDTYVFNITEAGYYTLGELPIDPYLLTSCGNITSPGYYNLTQNVSSAGTCFNVTSSNVILDGKGYTVDYATAGIGGAGINTSFDSVNVTIKNFVIENSIQGSVYGVILNSNYSDVFDNDIFLRSGSSSNSVYGIRSSELSKEINLSNNLISFSGNGFFRGIYAGSRNNWIFNNSVLGGGYVAYGITSEDNSTIERNFVNLTQVNNSFAFASYGDYVEVFNNSFILLGSESNFGFRITNANFNTFTLNTGEVQGLLNENSGVYIFSGINNTIENNELVVSGNNENYGVRIADTANIVRSNIINVSGFGSRNKGVFVDGLTPIEEVSIIGNNIITNGTSSNNAIEEDSGAFGVIKDNNLISLGTSGYNSGVHIDGGFLIQNNTIFSVINSLSGGGAIYLYTAQANISDNNITVVGSGQGHGIYGYASSNINISRNNISVQSNGHGIYTGNGDYRIYDNNVWTISDGSNAIDLHSDSQRSEIGRNFLSTTGYNSVAVSLSELNSKVPSGNTFFNNTFSVLNGFDIVMNGTSAIASMLNNTFANQTVSALSIQQKNATINFTENVSFFEPTTLMNVMNLSSYLVSINSTNASGMNSSAIIELTQLSLSNPQVQYDSEDEGTFEECNSGTNPSCSELSYSDGSFVFNVSHFTTYRAAETPDPLLLTSCGTIDSPGYYNLTQNVSSAGTCFQIQSDNVTLDCKNYLLNFSVSQRGHGINVTGNATNIVNCDITQDYLTSGNPGYAAGIYSTTDNLAILNTFVKTRGNGTSGVVTFGGTNVTLVNLSANVSGQYSYGARLTSNNVKIISSSFNSSDPNGVASIYLDDSSGVLIINSSFVGEKLSYGIHMQGSENVNVTNSFVSTANGHALSLNPSQNITFSYMVINVSGSGEGLKASSPNTTLTDSNITAGDGGSQGIYLNGHSDYKILRNQINATQSHDLVIGSAQNVLVEDNKFIGNGTSRIGSNIRFGGMYSNNVSFSNNSYAKEINVNITTDWINGTKFIDEHVEGYSFNKSILEFYNSNYGNLKFISHIFGSGTNLSRDVVIGNASLNISLSENIGLNASANVTFYGTDSLGLTDKVVYKNGSLCMDCTELVDADSYVFNITEAGYYTLEEVPAQPIISLTACGVLNQSGAYYNLTQSISTTTSCFNITASNITLNGNLFGISGDRGYYDYGVVASGLINLNILNMNLSNFGWGSLKIIAVNNSLISGGVYDNNRWGIHMGSSNNNSLVNFSASSNDDYGVISEASSDYNSFSYITANSNGQKGLFISTSDYALIFNNTAESNLLGLDLQWGIYASVFNNSLMENEEFDLYQSGFSNDYCDYDVVDNIGSGNRPILYYNQSTLISDIEASQIILCDADYSVLSNVTIKGSDTIKNNGLQIIRTDYSNFSGINSSSNRYGIYLLYSSQNFIENSTFKADSTQGLILSVSDGNELFRNDISQNSIGAMLSSSDNNNISNNSIFSNTNQGILLSSSTQNYLSQNEVYNNSYGLDLQSSSHNNTVVSNNLSENTYYGAYVNANSNYNLLEENIMSFNQKGLGLSNVYETTILNPSISNNSINEIYDETGDSKVNYLVFNNSNGRLFWSSFENSGFLKNLTLNGTLVLGSTIFVQDNNVSWNANNFSLGKINSTANITFYGVGDRGFSSPAILKNGVECTDCYNFTSLTADTVVFNVTSAGSYSIGEAIVDPLLLTSCGTIDSPGYYQLIQNVSSEATCFQIQSDNVTLDGKGYTINYSQTQNGYGINVTNFDLFSLKNTTVSGRYSQSGVWIRNSENGSIENNVFLSTGTWMIYVESSPNYLVSSNNVSSLDGIYVYSGSHGTNVSFNVVDASRDAVTIWTSNDVDFLNNSIIGADGLQIYWSKNTNVSYNNITAYSGDGLKLTALSDDNFIFDNDVYATSNTIYAGGSNNNFSHNRLLSTANVINLDSSVNASISENFINTSGSWTVVSIYDSEKTLFENNLVNGMGSLVGLLRSNNSKFVFNNLSSIYDNHALFVQESSDNLFSQNILNASHSIRIQDNTSSRNNFTENSFNGAEQQLYLQDIYLNGTLLLNQSIANYSLAGNLFSLENTTFGKVEFTSLVAANGTYLYGYPNSDIEIGNNSLNTSIGTSANMTLYGVGDRGFTIPTILKDGANCGDCYNFTSLTADTVVFNVTSAGSYSVGETTGPVPLTSCQNITSPGNYYLAENITIIEGSCFNITSNDVLFRGNGNSIIDLVDVGSIVALSSDNVTVTDFGLMEGPTTIALSSSNFTIKNSTLINSTIDTGSSGSNLFAYNISITNTARKVFNVGRPGIVKDSNFTLYDSSAAYEIISTSNYGLNLSGNRFITTGDGDAVQISLTSGEVLDIENNYFSGTDTLLSAQNGQLNVVNNTFVGLGSTYYNVINLFRGHGKFEGNNVTGEGAFGVYSYTSDGLWNISKNIINLSYQGREPIIVQTYFGGGNFKEVLFNNNSINSTILYNQASNSSTDIYNLSFENQNLNNLVLRTSYGQINFSSVNFTNLQNLSGKVNITFNIASVIGDEIPELNGSAIITFRNVSLLSLTNPSPYKNGEYCGDCVEILDSDSYMFSVTNAGENYSVGELPVDPYLLTSCGTIDSPGYYNLTQNVSTAGTCFQIQSGDVTLDGKGYAIDYAQSLQGNAVNTSVLIDNITLINLNIDQTSEVITTSPAIVTTTANWNFTIVNNSITTRGAGGNWGIRIGLNGYNVLMSENNITTLGSGNENYGIYDGGFNSNITNNIIQTNGFSSDSHAIYVTGYGALVEYNNLTSMVGNAIRSSTHNSTLRFNNLTTFGSNVPSLMLFNSPEFNVIYNNSLSSYGSGSRGITLSGFFNGKPLNNNFSNNNLVYINGTELTYAGQFYNGTWLIDQEIGNYSLYDNLMNVKDSEFGQVEFTSLLDGDGQNLSDEIKFANAALNISLSENVGLNASANVTFYNTDSLGLTDKVVYKNGSLCTDCTELVDADSYVFNITEAGYYTLGEVLGDPLLLTSCGAITSPGYYNLTQNVSSAGTCFQIQSDNVTLDGKGYTIDYAQSEYGIGVENVGFVDVQIKNVILLGLGAQSSSDAIKYDSGASNGTIENVTINTTGSLSYGIRIGTSSGITVINNFIDSSGYGLSLNSASGIIASNNSLTGSYGITLSSSSRSLFVYNDVSSSNSNGISLSSSFDNIISDNLVDSSFRGIHLSSNSYNNSLVSNSIIGSEAIRDTTISDYVNYLIYNNSYGKIEWINTSFLQGMNVTQSRINTSRDIVISNNSAFVNASYFTGGITSAQNISLYGMSSWIFSSPTILKDGVECTDCYNFTSLAADTVIFNVTSAGSYSIGDLVDITTPSVTNLIENSTDPSTYSSTNVYGFNATITDDNLSVVSFEFNGINYTPSNSGDVYTYGVSSLNVGNYSYRWFANDSLGNVNDSETGTFEVIPASTELTLTINDFEGNLEVENITPVNISVEGQNGTVALTRNGTNILSENSTLQYYEVGVYNITATLSVDSNHNPERTVSYLLTVTEENVAPNFGSLIPEENASYTIPNQVNFTTTIVANDTDNVSVAITLPNGTQITRYLENLSTFWNTSYIPEIEGQHNITFLVNDTEGNVRTENRTIQVYYPEATIELATKNNSRVLSGEVNLTANITSNYATQCRLYTTNSSTFQVTETYRSVGTQVNFTTNLTEGNHLWGVECAVGQTTSISENYTINVYDEQLVLELSSFTNGTSIEVGNSVNVDVVATGTQNLTGINATVVNETYNLTQTGNDESLTTNYRLSFTPPSTGDYNFTIYASNGQDKEESGYVTITAVAGGSSGGGSSGGDDTPECTSNSDCSDDGYVSGLQCSGDNLIREYSSGVCSSGSCTQVIEDVTEDYCDYGCSNGACIELVCEDNNDCGDEEYTSSNYCSGDNVVRNKDVPTCSGNSCSTVAAVETIETCEVACVSGGCVECTNDLECGDTKICEANKCVKVDLTCIPDWQCDSWGECANGVETRDCTDVNRCKDESSRPKEEKACQSCIDCTDPLLTSTEQKTEVNEVPCYDAASKISLTKVNTTAPKLEWGREIILEPLQVSCEPGEDVELTLVAPFSYTDYKVHTCLDGSCGQVKATEVSELLCDTNLIKQNTRTEEIYVANTSISAQTFDLGTVNVDQGKIEFTGRGQVTITPIKEALQQPANPALTLLGTPIKLQIDSRNEVNATIEFNYEGQDHVDSSTIRIYAYTDKWNYFEGTSKNGKVTAKIANITQYEVNGEVTLAMAGVFCSNCVEATLEQAYDGGNLGVVLVHGFGSSTASYQALVNDLALTDQPVDVWLYGYPMNDTLTNTIDNFNELMDVKMKQYDDVLVIAHSLGGIVAQAGLSRAHNEELSYVNKVSEVVLLGTPNEGLPNLENFEELFGPTANAKTLFRMFDIDSEILSDFNDYIESPKVPGIEYKSLAGTKPIEVSVGPVQVRTDYLLNLFGSNDGLLTAKNARTVGGEELTNLCKDYWELDLTHTELNDAEPARRLIGLLIADKIGVRETELGSTQYVKVFIPNCQPGTEIYVSGTQKTKDDLSSVDICFGEEVLRVNSCYDDIQNANEEGVDCGGPCIPCTKDYFFYFLLMFATAFFIFFAGRELGHVLQEKHGSSMERMKRLSGGLKNVKKGLRKIK